VCTSTDHCDGAGAWIAGTPQPMPSSKVSMGEYTGKFQLKGKGPNLPDPAGALADPVMVQLIKTDGTGCFSSTYTGEQIKRSDATSFKAKVP